MLWGTWRRGVPWIKKELHEPPNVRPLGSEGTLIIFVIASAVEKTGLEPNVLLTFSYWNNWKFWFATGGKNLAWPTVKRIVKVSTMVFPNIRSITSDNRVEKLILNNPWNVIIWPSSNNEQKDCNSELDRVKRSTNPLLSELVMNEKLNGSNLNKLK